ncbi:hypothetical protein MCJ35_28415 [Enterocloster sp. OA13]|uniref:Uncharacterized protein n=1 Tax=Enterocloster hominis (ex Hitch et al. 2024) TaxID=1917870 RepID=A0ABV1D4I8_9FIRM|nr:hypothetical protein CBFG_04797 [Clostridiales bacterium 1_7_47FAA]MCH1953131.1 hypothetical protein [Enterocloster sp. OA13]
MKGERDFYVRSLLDYENYGIEVKAGSNAGNTVTRLLKDDKIDYPYYLKGIPMGERHEMEKPGQFPVWCIGLLLIWVYGSITTVFQSNKSNANIVKIGCHYDDI